MEIQNFPYFNIDSSMSQSFYSSFEKYLDENQESDLFPFSIKTEAQQKNSGQSSIESLATKPTFSLKGSSANNSETKSPINNDNKPKSTGKKREEKKSTKGIHDKYCGDNIIRKIKSTLLSNLTSFINSQIYILYNGKVNEGILKKELKKLNPSLVKNVKDNKEFIYKTLKDIFCVNISGRYTNFLNDHNKILINNLLSEKDEEKRQKFEKLFGFTFLQCLGHFSGKIYIEELKGLKTFKEAFENEEDDKDYMELLINYALNFEGILLRKKSRNRSRKF